MKVKATAALGELGFVLRLVITGVGTTTLNGNQLELPPPLGFVTCTVQLSGSFIVVIDIVNCVLLMNVTSLLARTFDPPVHVTVTVGLFTKFVPVIVAVCGLVDPVIGFGLTPLLVGASVPLATVMLVPADCGPAPPVWALKPF